MGTSSHFVLIGIFLVVLTSCKKSDDGAGTTPPVNEIAELTYGDSILYVKDGEADNLVLPKGNLKGEFIGFPEGIELDKLTGEINVDKSETGLRYRVSFIPEGRSDTLSTIVLLSGINYLDKIYYLDESDTSALAVYNGRTENSVPGTDGSSIFDEGGGCNGQGVAVNINDGTINLAQTIRNGVLGAQPSNGAQKEVELLYRLNDGSKKAINKLKVKLYYFDTPDDITTDLVDLMNQRRDMFIGLNPQPPFLGYAPGASGGLIASNSIAGTARPRPPCIFVVGSRTK